MSTFTRERVLDVRHWTDALFSFTTTRPAGLRFASGQFLMAGLEREGRPLLRALSVASAAYADHLEFYCAAIPGGPLSAALRHVRPGDEVLVGRKATGTLVLEYLRPGRRLFLLATGTGLAPFLSLVHDPAIYERFELVVLAHGVRRVADLAYRALLEADLAAHPLVGAEAAAKLRYFPAVTREPFARRGRLTELIASGELPGALGLAPLDPGGDRVMICGSPAMLRDTVAILEARGFVEGHRDAPGDYVTEKAFVTR